MDAQSSEITQVYVVAWCLTSSVGLSELLKAKIIQLS